MNYELDEYEVNQILTVTKSYNENFKNGNTVKFDEYYSEIYSIMSSNENLSKLINPMFIKQMLLSLQKLMFKKLIDELLKLLEAIAVNYGFNAEGGSLNYSFSTNDSHSNLYKFIKLTKGIYKPKDGFFF